MSKDSAKLRYAAALLACLLTLLSTASLPTSAATAVLTGPAVENFLRNSSFNQGDDLWILKGEATYFDPEMGYRESDLGAPNGAIVMRRADHASEVIQTIGPLLTPGMRYTLSARVRALSPDSTAVIGVRWEGGHPRVFRGINPEDGWVKVEFRFEAPVTPGWRQVVLSGTGDLVWDDVSLYPSDTLEARLAKEWEERIKNGEEVYTGLVINALGTPLERGMNPRIFDEDGQLVFAGIGAGESQMFSEGIVAYSLDLQEGTTHPRLKVSDAYPLRLPLVVDAQGTRGLPVTDVIIGRADAARIRKAVETYDFLGRFAIVIVLEPFWKR